VANVARDLEKYVLRRSEMLPTLLQLFILVRRLPALLDRQSVGPFEVLERIGRLAYIMKLFNHWLLYSDLVRGIVDDYTQNHVNSAARENYYHFAKPSYVQPELYQALKSTPSMTPTYKYREAKRKLCDELYQAFEALMIP
jgi:hypothetical protein